MNSGPRCSRLSEIQLARYYGEGGTEMLQFKVLGPLEVLHDGQVCTPTPPKVRQVLALLLLRANQVVGIDALIEEVWGEDPPLSAVGTMQTYIHQLRKLFDPRQARAGGRARVGSPPPPAPRGGAPRPPDPPTRSMLPPPAPPPPY